MVLPSWKFIEDESVVLSQVFFDADASFERFQENIRLAETLTTRLRLLFDTFSDDKINSNLSAHVVNNLWVNNRRRNFPHLVDLASQN